MLYTMFAAAGTFALLSLLGAAELHARRRRCRDAALRAKYLRIVMLFTCLRAKALRRGFR